MVKTPMLATVLVCMSLLGCDSQNKSADADIQEGDRLGEDNVFAKPVNTLRDAQDTADFVNQQLQGRAERSRPSEGD